VAASEEASGSQPDEVRAALVRLRVVSGALMAGVAGFAVVATLLVRQGAVAEGGFPEAGRFLPLAFGLALAVVGLAAPAVGRVIEERARKAEGPGAAYLAGTIVRQAVREGAGIAGIVLGLLTGRADWILAFALLAIGAMALGWPREEALREATRDRSGRGD
jgi:hypothetical protein